ncbi:hypothetical protein GNM48_18500 [Salmonella enterica]|nr:hypothetical protein [Salmonella enterica]EEK4999054.1 hypothetical protein [Salmonella enterica]EFB0086454.1 hypothetical protein [Salmonella enterica]
MSQDFKTRHVNDFSITTNNSNLDELAMEVTALKIALGFLFRRMPPEHRAAFLMELQQFDKPVFNTLAEQMKQFNL